MGSTTVARRLLPPLAGLALLLAVWSGLAAIYPPILVPSPLRVAGVLVGLARQGKLGHEVAITVVRLLTAFGLGVTLGVALGLAASQSEALARLLRPGMALVAGVPPISWLALALIWFGTGSLTPILVALLAATPAVFVASLEGMQALDQDLLAMARAFELAGLDLVRELYLPALVPHLVSGLTVGATLTVRVGVMGEFLAANSGIGSAMALARTQLNTAEVVAWILVALVLLVASEGLVLRPLAQRAAAWRKEV